MFPFETMSAKMLDDYVGRKDALIIDLRGQEEYEKSHVKGAFNMPYERYMETGSLSMELSKGKILVFYCDRGDASLKVAKELAVKGYRTRSVIGGFHAYRGRNLVISG